MRTPALITLVSLLAMPMTVGAEIYTWKDESGKTHYGDKPPLEKKITTRELKSGKTAGGDATPAATNASTGKPAKGADGGASGGDATPTKSAEQLRLEAEARQKLCDNARTRVVQLESEKGVLLTKNDKGESAPLVGDARKEKLDATRKEVEQWCK